MKNRDEPNWDIIHICMGVPQENSLCSHLKQQKCHFFLVQNQRLGGQNMSCLEGLVPVVGGSREMVKEGEYGANVVYTYM
jgi:hypothetical protein